MPVSFVHVLADPNKQHSNQVAQSAGGNAAAKAEARKLFEDAMRASLSPQPQDGPAADENKALAKMHMRYSPGRQPAEMGRVAADPGSF